MTDEGRFLVGGLRRSDYTTKPADPLNAGEALSEEELRRLTEAAQKLNAETRRAALEARIDRLERAREHHAAQEKNMQRQIARTRSKLTGKRSDNPQQPWT